MSIGSHVEQLRKKHQVLEEQIEKELRSPGSDTLVLSKLKKEKLHVKEEITRLSGMA